MAALWIRFNGGGLDEIDLADFPPNSKRRIIDLIHLLCTRPELAGVGASQVTVHSPDNVTKYRLSQTLNELIALSTEDHPLIVKFALPHQYGPLSTGISSNNALHPSPDLTYVAHSPIYPNHGGPDAAASGVWKATGSVMKTAEHMEVDTPTRQQTPADVIAEFLSTSEQFKTLKKSSDTKLDRTDLDENSANARQIVDTIEKSPLHDRKLEPTLLELGIELPYKRLPQSAFHSGAVTVLVGVSGCGKSRTCLDICSTRPSLYFEVGLHLDFAWFLKQLRKLEVTGKDLETATETLMFALIVARISILDNLKCGLHSSKYEKLVAYQKSDIFQDVSAGLAAKLYEHCTGSQLQALACNSKLSGYMLAFDEAQVLLSEMENKYPNTYNELTRPLFRFLVAFARLDCRAASIWCGTHLRLKDAQLVISAAGGGKNIVPVFTDFQFYTDNDIKNLLLHSMGKDEFTELFSNPDTRVHVEKACYYLQGRAQLFTAFFQKYTDRDAHQTFGDVLDNYLTTLTERSDELVSFKYFWKRVINMPSKLSDFVTGQHRETPDRYCFQLLKQFLLRESESGIVLENMTVDLISTALVSLKKSGKNYYMTEPVVVEAAINLMAEDQEFEERFMHFFASDLISPATSLSPDARGKLFDKLIALRFRMGWWKKIPADDVAWEDVPMRFRDYIKNLEVPRYVVMERSVKENQLLRTFVSHTSYAYVLPAEKSGLDGCYRQIRYLGKTSYSAQNKSGDIYISSVARNDNLKYVDVNQWFSSIKNQKDLLEGFLKYNADTPMLFLCGEFPCFGPVHIALPLPEQIGNNWVMHLDLRLALARYLLGNYLYNGLLGCISSKQREFIGHA